MGKKSKRRGVVWSQDPSTGSPTGRDVLQWNGVSRTSKRMKTLANIDLRRVQLLEASTLEEANFESSFKTAYQSSLKELQESIDDLDELRERTVMLDIYFERLIDFLNQLRRMKRSAAKQRLVRHIYTSLEDEEWALLEQALLYAQQGSEEGTKRV